MVGFGMLFIGRVAQKKGWEVINAVKKRGKTRFLDLTTDKTCGETRFTDTMQFGKYNPECTFVFQIVFSGLIRYW